MRKVGRFIVFCKLSSIDTGQDFEHLPPQLSSCCSKSHGGKTVPSCARCWSPLLWSFKNTV